MRMAVRVFALLALAALGSCQTEKREVWNFRELMFALNDTGVDHVLMKQGGNWTYVEADYPPDVVIIDNRTVTMEGEGPGRLYMDYNKASSRCFTALNGAVVRQYNFWSDDCVSGQNPYLCFGRLLEGGTSYCENISFSDAACTDIRSSTGTKALLLGMKLMRLFNGGLQFEYQDDRTVHIADSGWLEFYTPRHARWRVVNSTFTCTGNLTHELADEFTVVEVDRISRKQRLLAAVCTAFVLPTTAVLLYFARKRARTSSMPENRVARAKGYELVAPLGAGHFGRVFQARHLATGQLVAIKVVDLLPSQKRQLAAAWQECQLLSQLQHECIVRVFTFYAAQVERKRNMVTAITGGSTYMEVGFDVADYAKAEPMSKQGSTGRAVEKGRSGESTAGSGPGDAHSRLGSAGLAAGGSGGDGAATNEAREGYVSIQVQLVMQYCDMGTLDAAIKEGRFRDPETGEVLPRHILLTALEIARGLEYLHHPDRRLVHRDLSAPNVLLATHPDERGFRALLSDFGLSTVLIDEQTHKTSEVKGTISYMSPEVFMHNDISPALDIYSLGIILNMMWVGENPFTTQSAAMVILAKVRALEHPEVQHMPRIKGCPREYQQLVWDCTHPQRQSRASAADVVRRLEAMLRLDSMHSM